MQSSQVGCNIIKGGAEGKWGIGEGLLEECNYARFVLGERPDR